MSGIASARSPRIEPGCASAGFVAPIVVRIVAIAPSPSTTSAHVGAGGDELDELAEERLLAVLGVVRLAELAVDRDELPGAEREAAALDPREDLAREPPLDSVGLDQDE